MDKLRLKNIAVAVYNHYMRIKELAKRDQEDTEGDSENSKTIESETEIQKTILRD